VRQGIKVAHRIGRCNDSAARAKTIWVASMSPPSPYEKNESLSSLRQFSNHASPSSIAPRVINHA
jgi:hypothetical protein